MTATFPIRLIFGSFGTFLAILLLYLLLRTFKRRLVKRKQRKQIPADASQEEVHTSDDDERASLLHAKHASGSHNVDSSRSDIIEEDLVWNEEAHGKCCGVLARPKISFYPYYLARGKFTWPFYPEHSEVLEVSTFLLFPFAFT
jgi:hypothetical protein